jgi:phage-related protein
MEHDTKTDKTTHTQSEKDDNSRIYQLKYIGQTGSAFHTRYNEHILATLMATLDTQTTY